MSKDTIYREDAIKEIKECIIADHEAISEYPDDIFKYNSGLLTAIQMVYDLPSADRPQGEWLKFGLGRGTRILFCTNCERKIEVPLSQGDSNYDFCPNCGAHMKGADDEMRTL